MMVTDAEREAYASCKSTNVTLYTIQLDHSSFTKPLRIVADNEPLKTTKDGADIEYLPFYFQITRPPISEEPDPVIKVSVDNVSGYLTPYFEDAAKTPELITLTFRPYLWNDSGDEAIITELSEMSLLVRSASVNTSSISITAALVNPANTPFPNETYTPERFPGL
ncbi:DUF1833 family protein [Shewanella sp. KX20019]|uniref:DUF1833 family protein n=1 Tax=Shewanella sp. KX20019 TaxID=2803864 RepID=UPI00192694E1|nr:DUF1833 family protein [Shewanella sp. KX20019]QQX80868.1 DUF1833 family protein [Shewanella sp. KX20019]